MNATWSVEVQGYIGREETFGDYRIKVVDGPANIPIIGQTERVPTGYYSRNRELYGCMSHHIGLPTCFAFGFLLCDVRSSSDLTQVDKIWACTCCLAVCGVIDDINVCQIDTSADKPCYKHSVISVNDYPMTLHSGSLSMVDSVVSQGRFGYKVINLGDRAKKDIDRMTSFNEPGSFLLRYLPGQEPGIDGK